jgi:hypothetical protein
MDLIWGPEEVAKTRVVDLVWEPEKQQRERSQESQCFFRNVLFVAKVAIIHRNK